ncbi:Hypothetical predicted protein [Octopus vulgaris]|uniref:Uncharacterized protein n=2 Tax=Octopus TaxID=6643 RepID=A0AA36EZS7_OCTVU|nr:putative uncharacterized protein DDB_G0277255 [Octopus sinensis]CAI9719299.1 Hypothetical predicted protein [Octopus vulgaris]
MESKERPKTLEPLNDNFSRSLVSFSSNGNCCNPSPATGSANEKRLVKQSVRNVVGNLENVLGNLQGIVGDIRVLVNQIECVSNKLDKKYGVYWKKGNNQNVNSNSQNNNNNNNNSCSSVDTSNRCSISSNEDNNYDTRSTDLVATDNMAAVFKQQNTDSFEGLQFSPDFDWTYITMATYQNNPLLCCTSPQFEYIRSPAWSDNGNFRPDFTEEGQEDCEELSEASLMSLTSTDISRCNSIPSSCSKHSILSSTTPSSVLSDDIFSPQLAFIDIFHLCCQNTGDSYCSVYEILMETTLESTKHLSDSFDSSDHEDIHNDIIHENDDDDDDDDDDIEAVDEIEVTSVGDYKANYDRDLNTWTTFTLLHTDSLTDSDDHFSETKSDILNDNTLEKLESTVLRKKESFRGSESSIFENIAFKENSVTIF